MRLPTRKAVSAETLKPWATERALSPVRIAFLIRATFSSASSSRLPGSRQVAS